MEQRSKQYNPLEAYKKKAKYTLKKIIALRKLMTPSHKIDEAQLEKLRQDVESIIDSIRNLADLEGLRDRLRATDLEEGEILMLLPTVWDLRKIQRYLIAQAERGRL